MVKGYDAKDRESFLGLFIGPAKGITNKGEDVVNCISIYYRILKCCQRLGTIQKGINKELVKVRTSKEWFKKKWQGKYLFSWRANSSYFHLIIYISVQISL